MQKTIINGITVLTADDGMKLTNGEAFGTTVQLGVNDGANNWREVTEAEAERLMAEAEADEELTDSEALAIIMGGATNA